MYLADNFDRSKNMVLSMILIEQFTAYVILIIFARLLYLGDSEIFCNLGIHRRPYQIS